MQRKQLVAAVAAVALAGTAVAPAVADDPAGKAPEPNTVAKDLLSPLSLAVTNDGTVFYSQNFAGLLNVKRPGKKPRVVYAAEVPGTEVGAVSVRGDSLQFATTFLPEEGGEGEPATALMGFNKKGEAKQLADLWTYEENRNPDGDVTYGLRDLPAECEVPEDFQPYPGIIESHPYATAQAGGRTFIADAAMNAIVKYGRNGGLSTVAVLPAQPVTVTEAMTQPNPEDPEAPVFPECTIGSKYFFEPVPTDVEVGPNGKLYVTVLPGGPEDPSLGARAAVYRVNPENGNTRKVVSGLLSATGLGITEKGKMFIAELFRGRIARAEAGDTNPGKFFGAALPGDVEVRSNGDIYATIQVLPGEGEPPAGQVIRFKR